MPSIPPAGYSPASAFELTRLDDALPVVPILADAIDAETGDYSAIDESATIADGLVVTLLRTERDSGAAVLGFGQRFKSIRHVTDDSVVLAESLTREALQPAVDAGVVAFRQIATQANPDDPTQIDDVVDYLDLLAPAAEQSQQLPVNLNQ